MSENNTPESLGQNPPAQNPPAQNPPVQPNPYAYPPAQSQGNGYGYSSQQVPGGYGFQGSPVNQPSGEDVRSSASLAVILGIIGWLPPLIFWVVYKDKPGYQHVRANAAATFNFLLPVSLMSLVLSFIPFLGWIAVIGIVVWQIIALVQGYSAAKEGRVATYPVKISVLS